MDWNKEKCNLCGKIYYKGFEHLKSCKGIPENLKECKYCHEKFHHKGLSYHENNYCKNRNKLKWRFYRFIISKNNQLILLIISNSVSLILLILFAMNFI